MAEVGEWFLQARSRWQEGARRASLGAGQQVVRAIGPRRSEALSSFANAHLPVGPRTGRDGFLFHRLDNVFGQLAARTLLTRPQLQVWLDAFDQRRAWCRRNDAAFRFLAVPEKHVVYRDRLPSLTRISSRRPAMRLLEALGDDGNAWALYPRSELAAARDLLPTFFRTDTHWTDYGALVAYRALTKSLAPEIALPGIVDERLLWKTVPFIGDLGVSYEPERSETRFVAAYPFDHEVAFQNHNFGRGAVHVFQGPRTDLPTCVLFRDSFANFLIPFLMQSFSRLVTVSSLSCHYDLLERERPDVVLFVVIERFLARFGTGTTIELPRDRDAQPFADFSGTQLDDIPAPPRRATRPQSTEISASPATVVPRSAGPC